MKKLICVMSFMLIICMISSVFSVSVFASEGYEYFALNIRDNIDTSYKEEIMPHFYPEIFNGRENIWWYYNMLYAHNTDTSSEPEYIVFIGSVCPDSPAFETEYFGDYIVSVNALDFPYELGYYVYVPSEQKVYTLKEAWDSEVLDITKAFESGRVGLYKYDLNMDSKFDVMDATYIHMYLAGFDGYRRTYRMDYDQDGEYTIMDATTIQRHLVGLDKV